MGGVIGCGTGRCGTMSLAKLLDDQPGWQVTHERFTHRVSWMGSAEMAARLARQASSDVAFYWLWYAPLFLDAGYRMICLRRERQSCVESWLKHVDYRNWDHWRPGEGESVVWDFCFPDFDAPTKRAAIERYWDFYHDVAGSFQRAYADQFRIFDLECLNSEEGVSSLLDFAGVSDATRKIECGLHLNPRL